MLPITATTLLMPCVMAGAARDAAASKPNSAQTTAGTGLIAFCRISNTTMISRARKSERLSSMALLPLAGHTHGRVEHPVSRVQVGSSPSLFLPQGALVDGSTLDLHRNPRRGVRPITNGLLNRLRRWSSL